VKNKKIIAVDFDGTLVTDEYPSIGLPNLDLINFIKGNKDKYIFILYTMRHGTDLEQAISFLQLYDIEFDYINENVPELVAKFGDTRKIYADYYIDDKNLTLDNWKQNLLEGN
jgi:hydroxymethylpyrimidine pyrophosphatase-like HAD family hydrolase